MELHEHRIHYRSLITTLFLGLCVIVIGVVYRYQDDGYFVPSTKANTTTQRQSEEAKPSLIKEIKVESNNPKPQLDVVKNSAQVFAKGDDIFTLSSETQGKVDEFLIINLFGHSDDKKPLGFDALLSIEGGNYDVVSVKSESPEFSVMKFVKNGRITITGILLPSVKDPTIWVDAKIATITIKPKVVGKYKLRIVDNAGRETSKIMVKNADGSSVKLVSNTSEALVVDITN